MTLKVLVTGAFSTGKTTLVEALAHALAAQGLTVARLEDVSRSCPFPLNEGQTAEASAWLATTQVARELDAAAAVPDVVLCDRGVPDILAHLEELGMHGGDAAPWSMRPFLEDWCRTYGAVLLSGVDDTLPPVADGLRHADPAYRTRLAECAEAVLVRFCDPIRLSHNPGVRLAQSLAVISA